MRLLQLRRLGAFICCPAVLGAQGPTSAAVEGRIFAADGRGVQGAEVVVTNESTGLSMRGVSRAEGRYSIHGLEPGGPYRVVVRRLGLPSVTRPGVFVSLGQQLQVDVVLADRPVRLRTVETYGTPDRQFSRTHTGTEAFLSASVIHRIPTVNRDLYDLALLAPQMSTWFTLTPSGAGPRTNSIRIDGVSDQVPSSNLAAGNLYGGRVIPLDAVEEYQVLLSPYDVRYGSFAGAGVNVVTRSGSNALHGSVFGIGTNERLGANVPFIRGVRYQKEQFGFSLGGPIVRDRLRFFVASEIQRRTIPAPGPSVDQPLSADDPLPASTNDIERFQRLLGGIGLPGASAGSVTNLNPSSSTFLRLDAPVARWNSRITLRATYGNADSSIFGRPTTLAPTNCPSTACFPLSSLQHSRWLEKRSVAAQVISNFAGGASNELVAGYTSVRSGFHPTVMQPLILVTVPGTSGAPAILQSGTHEIATGQHNTTWSLDVNDNLSFSRGAHRVTAGISARPFALRAFQLRGSYGVWEFASLDSLQAGRVARYRVTRDTGSVTSASGGYHAVYLTDEWEATPRLSLTMGLRADASVLSAQPPYVAAVDSIFRLRTDAVPSGNVQWSPRIGFNYRLSAGTDARTQLRGGAGIFSGQLPLFWLFGGFAGYGLAVRTLQCGSLPGDAGPAPAFRPDYDAPPMACGGGQTFGASTGGEIDVIDPHLRLPQSARGSLAIDAELPFGVLGTIEGVYTRARHALLFSSINLAPPAATDRRGRVLYGTFTASGIAVPSRVSSSLGNVITVANQSNDRAYDVTLELRKAGRLADVAVSFTRGRSRDVQSPRPVSALLADDWRFGRPVAGRQDDLALGTSDFDQPARVRAFGTLHSPWRRFGTDVSFAYVGGSGIPYTYVAGGIQGRGDLNADGAVGNDPIYIPYAATDTAEMVFAGSATDVAAQQAAFDRFVNGAQCLRAQRGRIMARNSCRSPWMHLTNVALQQTLPSAGDHVFTVELQIFNLLNLLDSRWGRLEVPTGATLTSTNQVPLLSQVGITPGPLSQPIYRFDPELSRYSHVNSTTYYQVQLGARYGF